ncbi:myosin-1-like [Mytilus californianus]|uniref:myosin-1-like n=1 Tax=Mytilus californianus TaxID=6549 RepID=UPI002245515C|nr:myosin-1-like [Mytilus californianus]
MWEKMYPKPRVRPTSADFDITILICLLREMIQKVQSPRGGFDHLPHKADTSAGACLAIIKHYRNFLAHPDQEKLRALSSTKFNDLFTQVGKAIQVLGNNQYSSKITVAKKLNIDNDIAQILEKIVTYEKQFQYLQEEVNRNSSQTRYQEKKIKELHEKYEEIENDRMEVKDSHQHVIDQMSEIRSNIKLQKEALEKRVKEQKQLAATQIKHGKQIQTLEQEASSMKKKQEDQRKDMKELTEKHFAITSHAEQLEKITSEHSQQLSESVEKTNKLAEMEQCIMRQFKPLDKNKKYKERK